MQVPNFLNYLKENVLIVTPGDRGDIIIAALQANLSTSYPKISGIVLSAGFEPEEPLMRLITGFAIYYAHHFRKDRHLRDFGKTWSHTIKNDTRQQEKNSTRY